jgi:hypothetical protein
MLRVWLWKPPSVRVRLPGIRASIRLVLVACATGGVLLIPVLIAFGFNLADGGRFHGPIYWRSSPPGVDLLAMFAPNPNHALFGGPWRAWLSGLPNGYVENVASLPIVGVAVIALAVLRYRFRVRRTWSALLLFFSLISLGPFVHIAGVNTFIPGPWALLRYVPLVTATRAPARYAIPMTMAFAVVFALALRHVVARLPVWLPARRPVVVASIGAALLFELMPFPRTLYSAKVPDIYRTIARDPRDVTVLQLPFGFRTGEWSEGNYSSAYQFFQTVHQKRLIGGYLSRISEREMERQHQSLTVRRLIRLSEGGFVSRASLDEVKRRAAGFIRRTELGYVVVDVAQASPELRRFAIDAYGLLKIGESDGYELFIPTVTGMSAATGPVP